jgi:CheY-like chemotaxis protein
MNGATPVNILLADDDPGDCNLTQRAFASAKLSNRLYVVNDGQEALDFLLHRGRYEDPEDAPRPDLVLLDLNMPKVDGREVLERMRSASTQPGEGTEQEEDGGHEAGHRPQVHRQRARGGRVEADDRTLVGQAEPGDQRIRHGQRRER